MPNPNNRPTGPTVSKTNERVEELTDFLLTYTRMGDKTQDVHDRIHLDVNTEEHRAGTRVPESVLSIWYVQISHDKAIDDVP